MQEKTIVEQLRVVIQVVDAKGVKRAAAADDAVNGITFFKQQLGEVAAILAGDSGDKGCLHKIWFSSLEVEELRSLEVE